ncbi:MAG: VOC family protein [Lachnospiraceae bacterium]|nr:VOC family protein [Lachnospiraceae bacterium]
MKLKNILIAVNNMEKSIHFYKSLFGLQVILDNDANVILTEGLVLQDASVWKDALNRDILHRNNAALLYFEERDMDTFLEKLHAYDEPIQYVTPLTTLASGQKLIRLYDPDGNLIEVRTS